MQDEGVCENDHQLSVAGKIKKHFNTSPKVNDTTAGVSVISVSRYRRKAKAESDKAANKKATTFLLEADFPGFSLCSAG